MLDRLGYESGGDLAADLFLGASDWERARRGYEENDWGQLLSGAALGTLAVAGLSPTGIMSRGGRQALQARMAPRMGDELVDGRLGANLGGGGRGTPPQAPARDELTERFLNPDPSGEVEQWARGVLPDDGLVVPWEGLPIKDVRRQTAVMAGRGPDSPIARIPQDEVSAIFNENQAFRDWVALEYETAMAAGPRARNLADTDWRGQLRGARADAERMEWFDVGPDGKALSLGRPGETPPLTMPSGDLERGLLSAVMRQDHLAAAEPLGAQLRNMAYFADQGLFLPDSQRFYPVFTEAFRTAEQATGMPAWMLNVPAAAASQQAAPWDEMSRLFTVAPFIEKAGKGAVRGNYQRLADAGYNPKQGFYRTALDAAVETINNPNALSMQVPGIADKTLPYAISRHDPTWQAAYVGDTVDGVARYFTRGRKVATGHAQNLELVRWNQFVGRLLGDTFGATPQRAQERIWGLARQARDSGAGGQATQGAFEGRIPGRKGVFNLAEFATETARQFHPDVVDVARSNMDAFLARVRAGAEPDWVWDARQGIASPRSVDQLIPPRARNVEVPGLDGLAGKLKNETLQRAMLRATASLSKDLRSKIAAFSQKTGVPAVVVLAFIADRDPGELFEEPFTGRGEVTDLDVERMLDDMDDEATDWV